MEIPNPHQEEFHMNRFQRRKAARESRTLDGQLGQFEIAHQAFHRDWTEWATTPKEVVELGGMLSHPLSKVTVGVMRILGLGSKTTAYSSVIYRGAPILPRLTGSLRNFSDSINTYQGNPEVAKFSKEDVFQTLVHGTSLRDIEAMDLPLATGDIRKINRFMRAWGLPKLNPHQRLAQEVAMLFPAQYLARPSEARLLQPIRPLYDRLKAYFDYFVPFITEESSEDRENQFALICMWIGERFLQALGYYLPARLGLTPSSILKLLYEREYTAPKPSIWSHINPFMAFEIQEAHTKSGLPANLQPYSHFNQAVDQRVHQQLTEYYSQQAQEGAANNGLQKLLNRLGLYGEALRADVRKAPDRVLSIQGQGKLVREILVASVSKQNLIFVLLFDNNTYLTLEVSQEGRLYGLPPTLLRDNPYVGDQLAKDVLDTVLSSAGSRHPEIEGIKSQPTQVTVSVPRPKIISAEEEREEDEKPIKRKRLPAIVLNEPELPKPPATSRRLFRVIHSRSGIRELLGKNMPDGDLDRIMESIKRFELGEKGVKPLEEISGCYILRVGMHRIVLESRGGSLYSIYGAGNRRDVYERL